MQDMIIRPGLRLPKLGLGTFNMKGPDCTEAVVRALSMGYRHIDTAERYENEEAIGAAIARSEVPRDAYHVTSKVWWDHLATAEIEAAISRTLRRLGTDYVDLYLVHWPTPDIDLDRVMGDMARLVEQGKARAIGVANFTVDLLRRATAGGAAIACNQVEYHVLLGQAKLRAAMAGLAIPLVAYAPLAQGRLTEEPVLVEIARRHGVGAAQVGLAWLLEQPDVAAIPKAAREESQRANLEAAALRLTDADRAAIAALPKDRRFVQPAFAPAWDD